MLDRKVIVFISLGTILLIGIIIAVVFKPKANNGEQTKCYCPSDKECNASGECIPKSQCGNKIVPPGQNCSIESLYCDPIEKTWKCKGNCKDGWEGEFCNCPSNIKPPVSDVCKGEISFCQTDGTWKTGPAKNCNDINIYLKDVAKVQPDPKNPSRPLSDIYCNSGQCQGIVTCQEPQGIVEMVCQQKCSESPKGGECGKTSDTGQINCKSTEACICDITTNYGWQCETVFNPSSGQNCPPDPPQKYCKDQSGKDISPLPCVPCYLNGNDGFIRYCPGSGMFPLECITSKFGLYNVTMPTKGSDTDSTVTFAQNINLNPPVYPSIDNVLCKQGQYSFTKLQDVDYEYQAVGNPNGNVVYEGNSSNRQNTIFVPFDPKKHYYYPNKQDPTVANCLWDDVPTCSSRGKFVQFCDDSGKKVPCDINKWDTQTRTNTGYCDCSATSYNSLTPPVSVKKYKGDQCQYDDNTNCSSHGSVKDDGTCDCLSGWFGNKCENNSRDFCSDNGTYDVSKSSCVCDTYSSKFDGTTKSYIGDKCQYDDNFCNDKGKVYIDQSGNPKCQCNDQTVWGERCELESSYNFCNHKNWNTDSGTKYCVTSDSQSVPCGFKAETNYCNSNMVYLTGNVNQDKSVTGTSFNGAAISSPGAINNKIDLGNNNVLYGDNISNTNCPDDWSFIGGKCFASPGVFTNCNRESDLSGYSTAQKLDWAVGCRSKWEYVGYPQICPDGWTFDSSNGNCIKEGHSCSPASFSGWNLDGLKNWASGCDVKWKGINQ